MIKFVPAQRIELDRLLGKATLEIRENVEEIWTPYLVVTEDKWTPELVVDTKEFNLAELWGVDCAYDAEQTLDSLCDVLTLNEGEPLTCGGIVFDVPKGAIVFAVTADDSEFVCEDCQDEDELEPASQLPGA